MTRIGMMTKTAMMGRLGLSKLTKLSQCSPGARNVQSHRYIARTLRHDSFYLRPMLGPEKVTFTKRDLISNMSSTQLLNHCWYH